MTLLESKLKRDIRRTQPSVVRTNLPTRYPLALAVRDPLDVEHVPEWVRFAIYFHRC